MKCSGFSVTKECKFWWRLSPPMSTGTQGSTRSETASRCGQGGLREGDGKGQGVTGRVGRLPMRRVLRTEARGETQGFMKAVVGGSDDRIFGFTMIGSEAGEVMVGVQMAILANLPY